MEILIVPSGGLFFTKDVVYYIFGWESLFNMMKRIKTKRQNICPGATTPLA